MVQAQVANEKEHHYARVSGSPVRLPTPPATDDSIMQRVRKRMRSVYEEEEEEEEEQPEEVQDTDTVLPVHGDATLHACSAALKRRRTAPLEVNQRARPFSPIVPHSVTLPDNVPSKSAWVNGLVAPASSPIYHDLDADDPMVMDDDRDAATFVNSTRQNVSSACIASLAPQWRIVRC